MPVTETMEVDEELVEQFAEVSGDFNPIHMDEDAAEDSMFGERVAHGMLTASLISNTLESMEGDVILMEQNLKYVNPVFIGETVKCEVLHNPHEKGEQEVITNVYKNVDVDGIKETVIEGEAVILQK